MSAAELSAADRIQLGVVRKMKKLISILLSIVLVLSFVSVFAEEAAEEVSVLESDTPMAVEDMPHVFYGTAVIDGKKDEAYTEEAQIFANKPIDGTLIEDGTRGYVWLCWDYEALYVYAEMEDKDPSWEKAADEYLKDSFECFVDADMSRSVVNDTNDAQYRTAIDGKNSQGLLAPTVFESAAVYEEGSGRYSVEIKCPWFDILPAEDSIVGFEVQVNDGNAEGKRQSVVKWYDDTGSSWERTTNYGSIILKLGDNYEKWDGKSTLKISVNGYLFDTGDTPPVMQNDRTLVPMRMIFEALGAGVAWNDEEQAAYVVGNNKLIIMPIGSCEVKVNGEIEVSDVPIQLINDRTMVPLRFVSELLGADVKYDDVQGAVFIKK